MRQRGDSKKTGIVSCRLPESEIKLIDLAIDKAQFASKSRFVRSAVRRLLFKLGYLEKPSGKAEESGINGKGAGNGGN